MLESMKTKIKKYIGIIVFCISFSILGQNNDLFIKKMTAINPKSYTDVVYVGQKDTVVVSTYSGRLSLIVRNNSTEKVIVNLGDEIYSLAYNPIKNEIAASTLENGIKIINLKSGKILNTLKLGSTWSNNILYSNDFSYLIAHDVKGNRYVWNVISNYEKIGLPQNMPNGRIFEMTDNEIIKIVSPKKIYNWDFKEAKILSDYSIDIKRFGDIDEMGNLLSVDFNTCSLFDSKDMKSLFTVKHPNWLRDTRDYPNYESLKKQYPTDFTDDGYLIMEGYSMQLTMVRFIKDKICTASIDRSIRVWDKSTGSLIETLKGHTATVNRIKVNKSDNQLVSIDLKGGIKFWDF